VTDRVRFRVIPNENGMALRALLARRLQRSGQEAASLIRAGGVYVNKLRIRIPNVRVATGERVTIYRGADEIERVAPSDLQFVHRDAGFCVIDKPPAVPAEFTRESCYGTLCDALVRLLADEGVNRPYVGIVHPLDRRASGLVMFATRGMADPNLHRTLVELPIRRTYRMLTRPEATRLSAPRRIELGLVEQRDKSLRLPRESESGISASLELAPVGPGDATGQVLETTLVDLPAERIPFHARAADLPLQGDDDDAALLALWCARMELEHPVTHEAIRLEAAPPPWLP
jgi:23S rRNA-/tRNA-specific pseudouridylate synthase